MSVKYIKKVDGCHSCPAIYYLKYEGSTSPQYWNAECTLVQENRHNRLLPADHVIDCSYKEYQTAGFIPERNIPDWCPLQQWEEDEKDWNPLGAR